MTTIREATLGMTYMDAAWRIACEFDRVDIDDGELDWLLWERTAFPVAPWPYVANQLREHFRAAR